MTDADNRTPTAAFERIGDRLGPFVLTCEHASNRVPPPLTTNETDREFLQQHWGIDIGAAEVTRFLSDYFNTSGILSTFSRLVADPNRDPSDDTFILPEIDGVPVSFNYGIDEAEAARRVTDYFEPFHAAVDALLTEHARAEVPAHLVSIHSFTPVWYSVPRNMEMGVLFDHHDEDALKVRNALEVEGFAAALNEPYSGKMPHGLIYGVSRHGRARGIKYLELEIRQDLIGTPSDARAVAAQVARALEPFVPHS